MLQPVVDALHVTLSELALATRGRLTELFSQAMRMPTDYDTRAWLWDGFPDEMDPWLQASQDVSADWYAELAPDLDFVVPVVDLPSVEDLRAKVGWATKQGNPLESLTGIGEHLVFDMSRDTIVTAAEVEPGARWVRYASQTACEFCRLMATLTGDGDTGNYRTEQSALYREDGEKYHDHCTCLAVAIRPGDSWAGAPWMPDWRAEYERALEHSGTNDINALLKSYRELAKPAPDEPGPGGE